MNKSTNLRPEAGGDPAQSNNTGLKNDDKVSQASNDFPDGPAESSDDQPQDKPDLDAFAKRMGTDTIESGDGLDAVPEDRAPEPASESAEVPRVDRVVEAADDNKKNLAIGGAVLALAVLVIGLVRRRRKQRGLVAKALALGAAVHVIRD